MKRVFRLTSLRRRGLHTINLVGYSWFPQNNTQLLDETKAIDAALVKGGRKKRVKKAAAASIGFITVAPRQLLGQLPCQVVLKKEQIYKKRFSFNFLKKARLAYFQSG